MTSSTPTRRTLLQLLSSLPIFRSSGGGASSPQSFTLCPDFRAGQSHRYLLEIDQRRNGVCAYQARMAVSLGVRAAQDAGWVLEWCIDRLELLDALPEMRPLVEALGQLSVGLQFGIRVNEVGQVMGFDDAAAVQRAMAQIGRQALDAAQAGQPGNALFVQMQPVMSALFSQPSVLEQSLLKEPRMLLGGLGNSYQVGDALEVRTRVPSLLGSGEVPVLGRFTVREARVRQREIELGWLMVMDNSAARTVVQREVTQAMNATRRPNPWAAQGASLPAAMPLLDFDDRATLVIDLETARPVRGEHLRRLSAGGLTRTEQVRWMPLPA